MEFMKYFGGNVNANIDVHVVGTSRQQVADLLNHYTVHNIEGVVKVIGYSDRDIKRKGRLFFYQPKDAPAKLDNYGYYYSDLVYKEMLEEQDIPRLDKVKINICSPMTPNRFAQLRLGENVELIVNEWDISSLCSQVKHYENREIHPGAGLFKLLAGIAGAYLLPPNIMEAIRAVDWSDYSSLSTESIAVPGGLLS